MFTGIIQSIGYISSITEKGRDWQLGVDLGTLKAAEIASGDSIAVNGVCLTAIQFRGNSFVADVSVETLAVTTLGQLKQGNRVNLELALTPTSRLGGHLLSGHVDGTGEVIERVPAARSERFTLRAPAALSHYIAAKGSICVDGISLTVNTVEENTFSVNIVPHTLEKTTLGDCRPGALVNIEIDVIARYLERLLMRGDNTHSSNSSGGLSEAVLREAGFIATGD